MLGWRAVALVSPTGTLRAPGAVVHDLGREPGDGGVVLTGHAFGSDPQYARLVCHHLAGLARPWAALADLAAARDVTLLRLARRSGCRALVFGPERDLLARDGAAADLRRVRRAGLETVVRLGVGGPGDDAGVFARAVRLCVAGRVTFPLLVSAAARGMDEAELAHGLAWATQALHGHVAIWRRAGLLHRGGAVALVAGYAARRRLSRARVPATPTMRVAHVLGRPIRVRERVPFVSTLVDAVHVRGGRVRSAWCRVRARHDEARAALVIRLEGTLDARAARTIVARVRRVLAGTSERIVIDVGGLERVSLTVLTRFLEEHAERLAELHGRLAFLNLRPALAALRANLHGMLPNAALLEHALEEA